jgi:hypothetical protein
VERSHVAWLESCEMFFVEVILEHVDGGEVLLHSVVLVET